MKKLFVAVLIVLFGTQSFSQDLNKGLKAYNAGDYATALKEWKPLAEEGNARAQHNLGVMYQLGRGFLEDATEAVKWYRLSAEQGYAEAQYNLGNMYRKGNGVLKDYTEVLKWWRLSAEQGNTYAQHNLGVMYQQGKGVLQDNVTAHMWYDIALTNGREKAVEWRDKVAGLMTADAIEKATTMARKCMTTNYKKCGD